MSGLETLPPDQRAVLQLILVQGRGYADLAATLRLDADAVRERAHAGAVALGVPGGDALEADTRGRVVDYLLGQQDDGERIVTFAELGASPAACRWAQELRAQLAGVASDELPEVPASATAAVTNGSGGSGAAAIAPTPAAVATASAPSPAAPVASAAAAPAPAAPPRPPAPGGPSTPTGGPSGPRPSRLGGAILIAGAAALAIVLAIVLIGGNDSPRSTGSTSSAQAQTSARTQTGTTTAAASGQTAARTVGGAVLRATSSGGSAFGAALVQQSTNGRRLMAVEVARLPGNSGQDFYAIWLQGATGNRFLGFVPRQVRANGTFTVSSALPSGLDLSAYSTVLVTSEGSTAVPSTPGTAVVSGPLRLTG